MPKLSQIAPKANPGGSDTFVGVDAGGADFRGPMTALMPTGAVLAYGGGSAPGGWLLCDGSTISRTTYANLFAVLGTAYGAGDGSTTFGLPDMRGRGPVGVGANTWTISIPNANVNAATDQITVTADQAIITGRIVQLTTTGTLPGGLAAATNYYIIVVDSTHIKLATSLANAEVGTAIDITSAGTGTHTATHTGTTRARGDRGGEETHALIDSEMPRTNIWTGTPGFLNDFANFGSGSGQGGWTATSMGANVGQGRLMINGGQGAHNTMQPFSVLNFIVKT